MAIGDHKLRATFTVSMTAKCPSSVTRIQPPSGGFSALIPMFTPRATFRKSYSPPTLTPWP